MNLKTYRESLGKKALGLASISDTIVKNTGVCISLAPQLADLRMVVKQTESPVFSQHIDPISFGKFTGHVLPEAVKGTGAIGTVLNHAENKRENDFIENTRSSYIKKNLHIICCCLTNIKFFVQNFFYADVL